MITVSCSSKFHAFQLAEQFNKRELLHNLMTVYHEKKNRLVAQFNGRIDNEKIDLKKIVTFPSLSLLYKFRNNPYRNNDLFDSLVASYLRSHPQYKILVGWSGMSLKSMTQAKKDGKILILERGSSHIQYQQSLLEEEHKRWGLSFNMDHRIIDKELEEYGLADFITVPSDFVKKSFLEKGIHENKIFKNNFGASQLFQMERLRQKKFTILYLGSLTIRKGLPYLFESLSQLKISIDQFEVWFVGRISHEIRNMIDSYQKPNWKFFGHIPHHELPMHISTCHVAVHPSIEEGLSMVIPQVMSCGVPVIATTHTGGEDIISDGENGFIVPIRSPEAISQRLTQLFEDRLLLESMQVKARERAATSGTWDNYGDRYAQFVNQLLK